MASSICVHIIFDGIIIDTQFVCGASKKERARTRDKRTDNEFPFYLAVKYNNGIIIAQDKNMRRRAVAVPFDI